MRLLAPQLKELGYTMIEMMIVIFIIVVLSTVLFANYNGISKKGEVLRASEKLKNELRRAQIYSFNLKRFNGDVYNWGVSLDRTSNSYVVFADKDNDMKYSHPTKLLIHGTETVGGGSFTESSNSGNTVTLAGNVSESASPGKPDNSPGYWQFDGTGDYLFINDQADFDFLDSDFVVDFWFKSDSSGQRTLISKDQSFYCYKDISDIINCKVNYNLVSTHLLDSQTTILNGNWYHLALTRQGRFLRLYLGGKQKAIFELPINASIDNTNSPVLIGSDPLGDDWFGAIDEIRLAKGMYGWNKEFSIPVINHQTDEEAFKTVVFPPGLIITSLTQEIPLINVDFLNIYFARSELQTFVDTQPKQTVNVTINNLGETMSRTLEINPTGAINIIP